MNNRTAGQPNVSGQQTTSCRKKNTCTYEKYQAGQSIVLGIIQIVIGLTSIGVMIGAVVLKSHLSGAGHGFWAGSCFLQCGAWGISAGKYKTKCSINTFMGLSIVSAILCFPLLVISAVGVDTDNGDDSCYFGVCFTLTYSRGSDVIAMNGVLVAVSLLECICAIWSSALCCAVVCCGSRARTGAVLVGQAQIHYAGGRTNQQVTYVGGVPTQPVSYVGGGANGQLMVVSGGQPVTYANVNAQNQSPQYAQQQTLGDQQLYHGPGPVLPPEPPQYTENQITY